MSRGPRRLLDDPDFKWETGCDLADEASLVGDYSLGAAKAAVMDRIASVAASGGEALVGDGVPSVRSGLAMSLKPALFGLAGLAVVGVAFWLGYSARELDRAPELQPDTPVKAIEAPVSQAPSVPTPVASVRKEAHPVGGDPRPAVASVAPSVPRKSAPAPVVGPKRDPGTSQPGPSEAAERVEAPIVDQRVEGSPADGDVEGTAEAPMAQSELQTELARYDTCLDALDNKRHRAASECFRSFLHAYPASGMVRPAELGLLRSLKGAGDAEGTEAMAERLAQRSEYASLRPELLRLRAESLARLGRCEDALAVARSLTKAEASEIRKACR